MACRPLKSKSKWRHRSHEQFICVMYFLQLRKGTLHKTTIRKRKGYESQSDNGCFITTACVTHKGLSDDCYELKVLRNFRDTYVTSREEGARLIKEYYNTAPLIIEKINSHENINEIYSGLYLEIKKAVSLIENKMYSAAFELYCKIALDLKSYLVN
jgi:hypothetical protein